MNEESRFHRRAKNVSRGHSAITEPAFMGRQRTEEPMLDKDPRRKPGKKLLDATMFVKWAIIKLLITMHVAMPADIFTKAVDLMTNIPWVYRILSESRPPSGKRGRGAQTSSSNTEPVLETAHEDAERDDEHPVGNTAKLTRLLKASTDTLSLMA